MPSLAVHAHFHDGRYHGRSHGGADWPPSPARLFQALVAGAGRGGMIVEKDRLAFAWLESLDPPLIMAPAARIGQGVRNFVANNDLDVVGGNLNRIGEIRTPKLVRPILFDSAISIVYLWSFDDNPEAKAKASQICAIAERLYQLGRGVDMAWAWAETVGAAELEDRLSGSRGAVYRPAEGGAGAMLTCPQPGSLKSLEERYGANARRFTAIGARGELLFSQPPEPRFRAIPYNSPTGRLLFGLRTSGNGAQSGFAPWPLSRAVALVTIVRDAAAARLRNSLPHKAALIDRVLIGRDAAEADKAARVRVVPLPSVGHPQADHAIRRILVEIPPNCPISHGDVEWAFSGLHLGTDYETGEIMDGTAPILAVHTDLGMLRHYGIERAPPARVWRTVTAAALAQSAARRRIEPARLRDPAERKGAPERTAEQNRAACAVIQSLRHAGIADGVAAIRVQREPFVGKGERAEAFAPGTRFVKERLWHAEITFARPAIGPVIIGDGRYLGLGLMQPIDGSELVGVTLGLGSEPRIAVGDRSELLGALRRALMSLARRADGRVPRLFSGHEIDGAPAQSGRHEHVFLSAADLDGDGFIDRLLAIAPWSCDRSLRPNHDDRALFDRVVGSLASLRAGRLGVISLRVLPNEPRLIGPARDWESHTEYRPTRYSGRNEKLTTALLRDVVAECERRALPRPQPEVLEATRGPRGGVTARVHLRFAVALSGPIMLGRDSHKGGGLFLAPTNM
jgi:CRISPR-associated protein Csb2